MYTVKELFLTWQGEGVRTGWPAVFCRFAGCNLWSGRESDRATAACDFCDTDFVGTDGVGGGRFPDADALATAIASAWRPGEWQPYVVFTGGEPALQIDAPLVDVCHARGFAVAIETNGTVALPRGIDWVTVSPKPHSRLAVRAGDELKLIYPQEVEPEAVTALAFDHFCLQPKDGPQIALHTRMALEYCRAHPRWRLSLQTHKLVGFA